MPSAYGSPQPHRRPRAASRSWRSLRGLAGLLLSLGCLAYVQWPELWRLMSQVNPLYLLGLNLLLALRG